MSRNHPTSLEANPAQNISEFSCVCRYILSAEMLQKRASFYYELLLNWTQTWAKLRKLSLRVNPFPQELPSADWIQVGPLKSCSPFCVPLWNLSSEFHASYSKRRTTKIGRHSSNNSNWRVYIRCFQHICTIEYAHIKSGEYILKFQGKQDLTT